MKKIKYVALALVLSASVAACGGGGHEGKTIGGTTDTMNSVEGSNVGDTTDVRANTPDKDSTSKGNADPSGRVQ